ncbi:MAG: substrate-binding domain-containing protein [Bryobacterales bacterium]|nr:substrate-binding domain-containing protein [Bryobacterales bacterium]
MRGRRSVRAAGGPPPNRREFVAQVAVGGLSALGCGCSQQRLVDTREAGLAFEDREWTVGFSNASETNTWRTALREAIEEEVAKYPNVHLLITDANDSPAKQVSDMEDLLTKGVDGMIIGAANLYVANPILDECAKEGIPVVIVDRKVASEQYATFVSTDHTFGALRGLSRLVSLIGGRGKIAIIEGLPGAGPAVERNAGYDTVLGRHPQIEAVRQAGDWSRASGQRVMENIITAHPDLDGIHFDSGEMAVGGIQALRAAGITDEMMRDNRPCLTWLDGYNGGLKMIKAGLGKYTIIHPPRLHGALSVKSMIQIFRGESVPKRQPIELDEVTQENVDQFVAMDKPDDFWTR